MNYISVNGKLLTEDEPALLVSNCGYRYGDGLFETMKLQNGEILLELNHFERLLSGLSLLKYNLPVFFTPEKLKREITQLCKKNNCTALARARLSVSRGNGGLFDGNKSLQYVIECSALDKSVSSINENGLVIDIYTGACKNMDEFANLKSANFLPYTMAALYAKENRLNDCLVLNAGGNVADAAIANIFIIKGQDIFTPALSEGCVSGVMRRFLLEQLRKEGYAVQETAISINDIELADEVFLTNAINGIRWVRQFGGRNYTNEVTMNIYKRFPATIPA